MDGAGIFKFIAEIVGFGFLALAVYAIGQRLRELLERAFGAQMQRQFPGEGPAVPQPDDVQALRDRGAL